MTDEPIVTPPDGTPPEPPVPPEPLAPPHPTFSGQQWSRPGPGWIAPPQASGSGHGGPVRPPHQGTPAWVKVLIVVGAILLIMAIGMAWGCYSCVRGCQQAVEMVKEGSYTISHDGETRWIWQGRPQPRDTAPPDAARDAATLAAGARIKDGIEAYRQSTGAYPDPESATPSAAAGRSPLGTMLAPYVTPWPTNPWTRRPMTNDPHRGDFVYVLWQDGTYTLRVFLSSGERDL
jgi:hypothetical protein